MASNNCKVGDKYVFTGDSDNFELNKTYTISRIYTYDYIIDQGGDPNYGKECVNFENTRYGIFLEDLPELFTKIDSIREEKINRIIQE